MTVDLRTDYMGLELANPVVAAASPLSGTLDGLLALEDAGAGAIVLQSLFEEQIEHHERAAHTILEAGTDTSPNRATSSSGSTITTRDRSRICVWSRGPSCG